MWQKKLQRKFLVNKEKTPMATITLSRSGDLPLRFNGTLLAEAGSRGDENRWHTLRLYAVAAGGWVLHTIWNSTWQGEQPELSTAERYETVGELQESIRDYDPLEYFVGPPIDHPKRGMLEKQIVNQYEQAVSDLFANTELAESLDEQPRKH
jgi:hypothetical protein